MMKLYHAPRARSLRVLWTLEELHLGYDLVLLSYPPRMEPDFIQENPLGTVPYLVDGPLRMNESVAICQYLASRTASPLACYPGDNDYGQWLNWNVFGEASMTYPLSVVFHYGDWYERHVPGCSKYPEIVRYYLDAFQDAMAVIEKRLEGRTYLACDRFTTADISVCYSLFLFEMMGFGDQIPDVVSDYWHNCSARESYRSLATIEAGATRQSRN